MFEQGCFIEIFKELRAANPFFKGPFSVHTASTEMSVGIKEKREKMCEWKIDKRIA